jgi:hypothetical protein
LLYVVLLFLGQLQNINKTFAMALRGFLARAIPRDRGQDGRRQ